MLGGFAMENDLYPIAELAKGRVDTHLQKKKDFGIVMLGWDMGVS